MSKPQKTKNVFGLDPNEEPDPIYYRHSPSSLNMFAMSISMFVLERIHGIKQTVGVPAHRGVAVEDGVTLGLMDPKATLEACVDVAHRSYDNLTAINSDPRRDKYRETIGEMVAAALAQLRRYGVPTATQGWVEWQPEGLRLPIVGRFDYEWAHHGIVADLKTTEKMPSEIKVPHARQVALYSRSDNMQAHLIYVTPRKLEAYQLENIVEHRKALASIAGKVENFLALSSDPDFFLTITAPDIDNFLWKDPVQRALAYKYWGI
jgi:hypothetical protein